MSNAELDMALAELGRVGIKPSVEHGGKHLRLRWQHRGENRSTTVALSASDFRAPMNVRKQIRAILRQDGLIGAVDGDAADAPHIFVRDGLFFASSLDIAKHFDRPHKDVLRAIDRVIEECGPEFGERNFAPSTYLTEQNKELRAYDLTRDGFTLVVMGFTGSAATKWKISYLKAFNAMEAEVRRLLPAMPDNIAHRLCKIEDDMRALIDLSFGRDAPPGFIYVKAHMRKRAERPSNLIEFPKALGSV